ncbi:poly(glycerol-phosphate) alpha-glucosyltransferase [Alkalicoccobacillus murimartini]|uniref:Poly(Glycerol-phosphate) alpha-glucosyltransferase n=2 Tax=Alkalicoccobacillus murimartini TaxID=171685 RepID=A0ABT9YG26_9BACI|nr:poly(glycerol-phosphate) alpha-glucosyltransferase [Alkalicoccobacillus murimartini]
MLQRAKLFYELAGKKTKILTLRYDPSHYNDLEEVLLKKGKINEGVNVINLYEYFRAENTTSFPVIEHPVNEDGYVIEKKRNAYRYFKNGLYIKYKKYSDDGALERIDFFNENRYCFKSEEYDNFGYLARTIYNDLQHRRPRQELYYRNDGTCYLSKWLEWDKESKKNKIVRITLFDRNGQNFKAVYSDDDLKHYFFDCIIGETEVPTFMIAEARSVDKLILKYQRDHVFKIYVVHTMHLEEAYNEESPIDKKHITMFDSIDMIDGVVILTNKQREDIEQRIGMKNHLYVIPHAISSQTNVIEETNEFDNKKIVIVARLNKVKKLDHAIEAIAVVQKVIPDVKLEIFGEGEERENLEELIKSLNLESNVKLLGFTDDPSEQYRNAAFSLLTSDYEGFGLVVLESLKNGCPVVSYDLKYGPSDIITHDKNGILVENKNIDELANVMIEILSNSSILDQLRDHAASEDLLDSFKETSFVDNWRNMYQRILDKNKI